MSNGTNLTTSDAYVAKHRAIAERGGTCALCARACLVGHYCYGCGEFVCFRHGEPARGTGLVPPHVLQDHGRALMGHTPTRRR